MITQVTGANFPSTYIAAQGQYVRVCARFKSDQVMAGFNMNINPGLYIKDANNILTLSPGFSGVVPAGIGGFTELSFQGLDSRFKNHKCRVTSLDGPNTTDILVEYEFLMTKDLYQNSASGYLTQYDYDSVAEIEDNTGEVYNRARFLDLKLTVDFISRVDIAHGLIEFRAKKFREDATIRLWSNDLPVDGWKQAEDLTVEFNLEETFPGNEMYAAIYRIDNAQNDSNFIEDLEFNMGLCHGNFISVVGNSDIPFLAFKDAQGWAQSSAGFQASVTIDKDYFTPGATYRVYLHYISNYENESVISFEIPEIVENNIPKINYDAIREVTIEIPSTTESATCYRNIAVCQEITIKAGIDKTDFDASLAVNGFVDLDFYDVFDFAEWTITNQLALNALPVFTEFQSWFEDLGSPINQFYAYIKFKVPNEWAGQQKYVNCKFNLKWPDGQTSQEIAPFSFVFAPFSEDIQLVGTQKNYICDTATDEVFIFDGPNALNQFLVKREDCNNIAHFGEYSPDFTGGDADLTLHYYRMPYGKQCFNLLASRKLADSALCEIICDWVWLTVTPVTRPENSVSMQWVFTNAFNPGCIQSVDLIDRNTSRLLQRFEVNGISDSGAVIIPEWYSTGTTVAVVRTMSGQEYVFIFYTRNNWGNSRTYYWWPCPEVPPPGSIGTPCDRRPYLFINCTLTDWDATLDPDGYTVLSFEYSTDDGNTWTPYISSVAFGSYTDILFRAILESDGNCIEKTLWAFSSLCPNCTGLIPVNPCSEVLEVGSTWDEGGEELTITSNVTCTTDEDTGLLYSYDGITWTAYTIPVSTALTDVVYYRRYVECENGCNTLKSGRWDRKCPKFGCSTGGGSTPAEYAEFKSFSNVLTTGNWDIPSGAYYVELNNTGLVTIQIVRAGITHTILAGQNYKFSTFLDHVTNKQILDTDLTVQIPNNGKVQFRIHYPISSPVTTVPTP